MVGFSTFYIKLLLNSHSVLKGCTTLHATHTQECVSLFKVACLGSPLHYLSCPYALLLEQWYQHLWLLRDQNQFLRNPLIWCGDGFLLIPSQRALLALCKPSTAHQKMKLRHALCDLIHLNELKLCFRSCCLAFVPHAPSHGSTHNLHVLIFLHDPSN